MVGPIEIGDGCRVSTGTIILRGVTVGSGSAIGAAALVTANCEPHSLYVGIPARKIRDLPV